MPIPEEILKVKRPVNTVVIAYGKNRDRYAVRAREGCVRRNGGNRPVNGATVGHIVNGVYVPIKREVVSVRYSDTDIKDWADFELCDRVFRGMLDELLEVYDLKNSQQVYCIAILRVCEPGIRNEELKDAYDSSFLSEKYPGVPLSKNTVCALMKDLGRTYSRIVSFMRRRTERIGLDHTLLIDGTLKTDGSECDSISDYSRKARVKGQREMSVMYLFDLDAMEPVCSKCYPGNMLDVTAYGDFIRENGITHGMIVADKGFPASAIEDELRDRPDLHVLNPLKRNSRLSKTHDMTAYTGVLEGFPGVMYKKEKCVGGSKWLYSFRDSEKAYREEVGWMGRRGDDNPYDNADYRASREKFGTIVLEPDLDMDPADVYRVYSYRWEIETVMRFYKTSLDFDDTRVDSDESDIGSEFCNFLSSVLTYRLISAFDKAGLLETHSYGDIMKVLKQARMIREDKDVGWGLRRISPGREETLMTLGLIDRCEPVKRGRGRPKKTDV